MKSIAISIGALAISIGVIAGGDDRDKAPVESLDTIATTTTTTTQPVANQEPETMKLKVGGSKAVSTGTRVNCQSELGLSESNIDIFKKAHSSNYLYNTGPTDAFGTDFSPMRWDDYFGCVNTRMPGG